MPCGIHMYSDPHFSLLVHFFVSAPYFCTFISSKGPKFNRKVLEIYKRLVKRGEKRVQKSGGNKNSSHVIMCMALN